MADDIKDQKIAELETRIAELLEANNRAVDQRRHLEAILRGISASLLNGPSFISVLAAQQLWSEETFGPGRRWLGCKKHIEKELKEIEAVNGTDPEEWADVAILALDGLWRCIKASYPDMPPHITASAAASVLLNKQAKNRTRTYPKPVDEDTPVEHIREAA